MKNKTSAILRPATAASEEDGVEMARLLRFGTLGWGPPDGAVVFAPPAGGDFGEDWGQWLRGDVARRLGEHLLRVRTLGDGMQAREIIAESSALDASLDGEAAARSRRAGASLLGVVASARQARLAERVVALLDGNGKGEAGIHLATAVALHSVVFPLPPLAALLGYAFAEWRAGRLSSGHPAARVDAERFLAEDLLAVDWAGGLLRGTRNFQSSASFG